MSEQFKIEWKDAGREPQCRPNPDFPRGCLVDASHGAEKTCVASLPYPAKRCGAYIVECRLCGIKVAATTAGRRDDPHSIKIPCRLDGGVRVEAADPLDASVLLQREPTRSS